MISRKLALHLPGWKDDIKEHPEDYYLVLSDDMDSYLACKVLNKELNIPIGGFYDFETGLYLTNDNDISSKSPIYVDASCVQDGVMSFDNHRTVCRNHMSINPNILTDRLNDKTYYKKYCGSTLLMVVALYKDLDTLTELEKEFMLAMDGFYIGYYQKDGAYRNVNIEWLELLGLDKVLLPVLEKHDYQYFKDLICKWQLNEKIYIENGELFTYRDILPHDKFYLAQSAHEEYLKKDEVIQMAMTNEKLFMASETYKGVYAVSILD